MKVIISGGGTAGHVNAGIAIAEEIKSKYPKSKILFVGTKRGIESTIVPKEGFNIKYINSRGIKKESFIKIIKSLFLIPISILQSFFIILKFNPNVVIGVGGFSSGPFLLASYFMFKRIFILEQNSVMGFTNSLLKYISTKVFTAFPIEGKNFICVGNPVRKRLNISENKMNKNKFCLFIFGGSQGSRAINEGVISQLEELNKLNIKIIHQTGKLDFERVKREYEKYSNKDYIVKDYIYDIENVYKEADLIVSRSGASSVFEIIEVSVPSILIPLPSAADNHQFYNAKYLVDRSASVLLEQREILNLANKIKYYLENKEALNKMKLELKKLKQVKSPQSIILSEIERYF